MRIFIGECKLNVIFGMNLPQHLVKFCCLPPKSSAKHRSHPNLEVFLSQIEHEIFRICENWLCYSNLSRDEWGVVCSLADNVNIVIKKEDKRSFVIVWGHSDYVMEQEKQLNDTKVYKNIMDSIDLIPKLSEKSNMIFESLKQIFCKWKTIEIFSFWF